MNEQISAWPIGANAGSIIQNLKPVITDREFTKTSTNIEEFSYVSKLVALTQMYMELSLPVPAALRAAEADLRALFNCQTQSSYKRSGDRGKGGRRTPKLNMGHGLRGSV
jgi:hypothetical protein